ncbi:MAG TPA: YdcH family protein [Sphingorhabdus sp.]|uniref:YdcH family protein n=1 Tax=uncultured Sphingorhabdus sp. TaxID=1686106 RepID=UPI00262194B0|nr:YdcH family protein [uncultured Sphingorhabdus sp.]HMS20643.1 YdcH family protein [Sphingorhabdus sp.]HMT40079.1 YdcH family protein [Sphingorhabdus sp.]HMU22154.1 YdcH family protein [Sphingorhabdus sp.]
MSENHLSALRLKHAELEAQLELEETRPHPDDDLIHRLKKQKLQLKDAMTQEMASA